MDAYGKNCLDFFSIIKNQGPRINGMIRVKEVNVVGDNGDQLGVLLTQDAINMAQDRHLDLVEVAPNSNPPVCRVMDYSKFKYQQSKRAQEAKKITKKTKAILHRT